MDKKSEYAIIGFVGFVLGAVLTYLILRQLSKTASTLAKTTSKLSKYMENEEIREIERDNEGFIKRIVVHRKVRRN